MRQVGVTGLPCSENASSVRVGAQIPPWAPRRGRRASPRCPSVETELGGRRGRFGWFLLKSTDLCPPRILITFFKVSAYVGILKTPRKQFLFMEICSRLGELSVLSPGRLSPQEPGSRAAPLWCVSVKGTDASTPGWHRPRPSSGQPQRLPLQPTPTAGSTRLICVRCGVAANERWVLGPAAHPSLAGTASS